LERFEHFAKGQKTLKFRSFCLETKISINFWHFVLFN
jgi:hypothetical protein